VVLPVALRHKVLKEAHDSIFACHLRVPQTYARVAAAYGWPGMKGMVRQWVQSCRDCGTRKAMTKEIIPPSAAWCWDSWGTAGPLMWPGPSL
jgi:hypothetical protein